MGRLGREERHSDSSEALNWLIGPYDLMLDWSL